MDLIQGQDTNEENQSNVCGEVIAEALKRNILVLISSVQLTKDGQSHFSCHIG